MRSSDTGANRRAWCIRHPGPRATGAPRGPPIHTQVPRASGRRGPGSNGPVVAIQYDMPGAQQDPGEIDSPHDNTTGQGLVVTPHGSSTLDPGSHNTNTGASGTRDPRSLSVHSAHRPRAYSPPYGSSRGSHDSEYSSAWTR
jgi:hypothetical protein